MKKYVKKDDGVSPVIAVILMVAITVVLSAVLYVMVSGLVHTSGITPAANMNWKEDFDRQGNYTGSITVIVGRNVVRIDDVSVTIIHDGVSGSEDLDALDKARDLRIGNMIFDYDDTNGDSNLGAEDVFTISGGKRGDTIILMYKETDGQMASSTLT